MDARPIKILRVDEFHDRLRQCLEAAVVTDETRAFEARLESAVCQRLDEMGENGWDLEVVNGFFDGYGGHGLSILIQNTALPWKAFGEWLMEQTAEMPMGAVVNYEVLDSIRDGVMGHGTPILRRVITSAEIFEEEPSGGV